VVLDASVQTHNRVVDYLITVERRDG
jgi:hypothetical protein